MISLVMPDEFAARVWRQFGRLRGWRSFPLILGTLLLGTAGFLVVVVRRIGIPDPTAYLALMAQSSLPLLGSVAVVSIWWSRVSTRRLLLELAVTPVEISRYVLSTFRPVRFIFCLAALLPLWVIVRTFHGVVELERALFYIGIPSNLAAAWFDPVILLWFLTRFRSTLVGILVGATLLFPLHGFLFISLVCVGGDIHPFNSAEPYIVLQGTLAIAHLGVGVWARMRLRPSIGRYMSRLIE